MNNIPKALYDLLLHMLNKPFRLQLFDKQHPTCWIVYSGGVAAKKPRGSKSKI